MTPRADQAQAFLSTTDWGSVPVSPLAGDASNRKYFRLIRPNGHTAVLMDADPAKGEDVRPFLHVAAHLAQIGLSAPTCLAQDIPKGFLLLEDLGDALFARVVAKDPALETPLYEAATGALVTLHANAPASGLKPYDPAVMTAMAALRAPIDAFFTAVQVNSDNDIIRRNRLNLLSRIRTICLSVADLTKLEG